MRKENCKGEEHNKLPRDPLGGVSCLSSPHQSNSTQLHCVKAHKRATTSIRDLWGKRAAPRAAASSAIGNSENRSVCQYRLPVRLTVTR
jgi:hypothetical protein